MNATQLTEKVAVATKATKSASKVYLETIIDTIKEELSFGGEVRIVGFGVFKSTVRKARVGRNPSTGEILQLPEKTVVKFKPYF